MPRYQVREIPAAYKKPDLPSIRNPEDVYKICQSMTNYKQEVFRVLLLTTRHQVFRELTVGIGTLNASLVHPRDVFRAAIRLNAAAVILVHNHPSGVPEPSTDDRELTDRLNKAGDLLGIKVLDHLVVATGGYVSLREQGLFPSIGGES
jgi:DNA repair protein RadC